MKGPGKPLKTTDEQLDMLALITPEDVEDAKATARQRMTPRGLALMGQKESRKKPDEPLPVEP
jgi:hypothetical protein